MFLKSSADAHRFVQICHRLKQPALHLNASHLCFIQQVLCIDHIEITGVPFIVTQPRDSHVFPQGLHLLPKRRQFFLCSLPVNQSVVHFPKSNLDDLLITEQSFLL
jgi:hypothetical protein